MNASVIYVVDDRCPTCGRQLVESVTETQVMQECWFCGWSATWAVGPVGGEQ
jgi:hypothetical protein